MTYIISQTDPSAMSTEDVLSEIDGFKVLAVEVVIRLSLLLKELRARRQPHPFFHDRILRFWESIAAGKLSPEAAILLGNQKLIRAILPLSLSMQVTVAKGYEVGVAQLSADGDDRSNHMPIFRMDDATLKRAFGPEGIRSIKDQAEMIRVEGKVKKAGVLTVLQDEGVAKAGNMKLTPEDMIRALVALGYEAPRWVGGGVDRQKAALV